MRLNVLNIAVVLLCVACSAPMTKQNRPLPDPTGDVLFVNEQRPNEGEENLRILVTDNYLRIDNGNDGDDYLLFNLEKMKIFNIVHDDQTILRIGRTDTPTPILPTIEWSVETEDSNALMARKEEGNKAIHTKYAINGEPCYSVISVKGLLPSSLSLIKAYRRALASELMTTINNFVDQDLCYTAINIIEPNRVLESGFPIREWSHSGFQRFLVDYKTQVIIPRKLFDLPTGYAIYGAP